MSLALDPGTTSDAVYRTQDLPLEILHTGEGVRTGGLDERHLSLLMETVEQWPPILVWGDDCLVIDGAHRVEAARRLGHFTVHAVRFIGTRDEAFIESVRRNVKHGLPLSVGDRRRAALRVLARNAEWSDRRIASLCGLSGKTIARLRREGVGAGDVVVPMERRVGRDGKLRPVRSKEIHDRIRMALEENPGGSLRFIAAIAGASPETVRTVRARMNGADRRPDRTVDCLPVVTHLQEVSPRPMFQQIQIAEPVAEESAGTSNTWLSDAALNTCGDGGDFAQWFTDTSVTDDWHSFVWTIPVGRIYEVVDEARRRAATWTAFASILESRIR
ncbi:MAG TPA: ParB/RepB/Spo0J family partition protein [Acidimicrobiales bacterium]|nr:ParB/RepB/Spo0J family partition protein [Acidimicrobiales bacterium]